MSTNSDDDRTQHSRKTGAPTARWLAVVGFMVLPIVVLLAMVATTPRLSAPMFDRPPETLGGIPLAAVLIAIPVAWVLTGAVLVARQKSPLAIPIGLLVFTLPAFLVILFGPAIILILQNLG